MIGFSSRRVFPAMHGVIVTVIVPRLCGEKNIFSRVAFKRRDDN